MKKLIKDRKSWFHVYLIRPLVILMCWSLALAPVSAEMNFMIADGDGGGGGGSSEPTLEEKIDMAKAGLAEIQTGQIADYFPSHSKYFFANGISQINTALGVSLNEAYVDYKAGDNPEFLGQADIKGTNIGFRIKETGEPYLYKGSLPDETPDLPGGMSLLSIGSPVYPIHSSPVIVNLDTDPEGELIFADDNGDIYAWNYSGGTWGSFFPSQSNGLFAQTEAGISVKGTPAIADLDKDGSIMEVVVGNTNGKVYVWHAQDLNSDGLADPVTGFPIQALDSTGAANDSIDNSVVLEDVNNDTNLEIIAVGTNGGVNIWNYAGARIGSIFGYPSIVNSSPAVGNIGGTGYPEIITAHSTRLCAWRYNGTNFVGYLNSDGRFFDRPAGQGYFNSSPALADVDGDGILEVAVVTSTAHMYALNQDATYVEAWPSGTGLGWPKRLGGTSAASTSSVAIGNLALYGTTGLEEYNQDLELVAGTSDGGVYALHHDGTTVVGWPVDRTSVTMSTAYDSSPALVDIDNDGDVEVLIGCWDGNLYGYHHDDQDTPYGVADPVDGFPKTGMGTIELSSPSVGALGSTTLFRAAIADLSGNAHIWDLSTPSTTMPWPKFRQNLKNTGTYLRADRGIPTISSSPAGPFSKRVGETLTFTVTGVDTGVAPLNVTDISAFNLPSGATFNFNDATDTGSFSWTPSATGSYTVTFIATDYYGLHSAKLNVAITVTANNPPVANNNSYFLTEDTPRTVAAPGVLSDDSDPDGDPIHADRTGATGPSYGTLNTFGADGSFTYTPNPNFSSTDYFTYRACDTYGACSGFAQVMLVVSPVPDNPVARDDTATTDEDVPIDISVLLDNGFGVDYDPDSGDTIAIYDFTQPANGTVTQIIDALHYVPNPDFDGTTDTFTYRIQDSSTSHLISNSATVTVNLNAMPDAPVAVNDSLSVNEDTPTNLSVMNNDYDPDTGDTITINSIVSAPSHGTATINTGNLTIRYSPAADYNGGDSFTYNIIDSTSRISNTATTSITVQPVPDAPVLANIETSALSYTEGQPAIAITTTMTATDVDSANLASGTVQITGNYASGEDLLEFTAASGITGSWNSSTGTMTLTGSSSVANYQAALRTVTYRNTSATPSTLQRTVSFRVNDGALNSNIATRNINVGAVGNAPVLANIETAALAYTENQAATAITGTITVTDADSTNLAGGTVQITGNYASSQDVLAFPGVSGITGSWNSTTGTMTLTGSATVANYQLALRAVTYRNTSENPSTLQRTVSFTVTDGALSSNTVSRGITIGAVCDAPVLANIETAALAYTENQSATAVTSNITISDVDSTSLAGGTVQITGNYASAEDVLAFPGVSGITGSWNSSTGTMTLSGSATLATYQTALRAVTYRNTSDNPSTLQRTVTFKVNDGCVDSNTVTRNITVGAVCDAPVLANIETSALGYTEGQAATAITSAITVTDVDSTNLTGGTVQITGNYASAEDVLAFPGVSGITGSWNSSTGTMTLTGSATLANYQAALRAVTYRNTSSNPSTLQRTVSFTVNDGCVNSNTVTRNITITPVCNAPALANIETSALAYTENQAATAITGAITVTDTDSTNLTGGTVQITGNYASAEDVLAFPGVSGITGSWNSSTGTMTLTGSATLANYQTALRSVTYRNTSENPSTLQRTVSFTVTDGCVNSNTVTRNITITSVCDAPVLANIETSALAYTENQAATAITSAITISDVDSANLTGGTIQITGNYASAEDVLAFTAASGITGSWNSSTGTMTLTGSATLANYQLALRSVTYRNTSENPSTLQRTVSFTVTDGCVSSNTVSRAISLTSVPDAPVLANIETSALSYDEGQAATAITSTITVTDVDSTNLAGGTVQITGNYASAEDILAFPGVSGITGSWNSSTGTMTLTGSSSVANYQLALRAVTYRNTSANPSTLQRTVSFKVNDGGLDSNTATRNINVGTVCSPPVLANIETAALAYTENQAATAITGSITVTDTDSTNLTGGTVQITSNYASSQDVLAFPGVSGITGSWNSTTGTMTLTGSATLANYQLALRAVTYRNTSENPSTATRTVTFKVNDGCVDSNTVTRNITIASVCDAPVLANIETSTLSYTENQSATVISSTITVTDADSTNLTGGTVQITANYTSNQDLQNTLQLTA